MAKLLHRLAALLLFTLFFYALHKKEPDYTDHWYHSCIRFWRFKIINFVISHFAVEFCLFVCFLFNGVQNKNQLILISECICLIPFLNFLIFVIVKLIRQNSINASKTPFTISKINKWINTRRYALWYISILLICLLSELGIWYWTF